VEESEVQTVKVSRKIFRPSLVWTGTGLMAVWYEVMPPVDSPNKLDPGLGALDLSGMESFEVLTATVDATSAAIGEPVKLDGAGSGPKKLEGPIVTEPAWFDETLALGWSLYNDKVEGAPAARFVVGRWKPDGTTVGEPVVLAKDRYHHMAVFSEVEGLKLPFFATTSGLHLAWASNKPASITGCRDHCGDMDSVAMATLLKDGTHDVGYVCGDAMNNFDVHRFGQGLLVRTDNEHVGDHTWLSGVKGASCHAEYYWSSDQIKKIIVTGSGAAVYYDQTGGEYLPDLGYKTVGHCVDILYAAVDEKDVECARPRSRKMMWTDAGLALVIESKSGKLYTLPFAPGEFLPVGMLRRALVMKHPIKQAVWTGSTIAAIWSSGNSLKAKIISRNDPSPSN
jgi:hypothetical protein